MGKKSDIENDIQQRYHQELAKTLLANSEFVKLLKEHETVTAHKAEYIKIAKAINLLQRKIPKKNFIRKVRDNGNIVIKFSDGKTLSPSNPIYKNINKLIEHDKKKDDLFSERQSKLNAIQGKIEKKFNIFPLELREVKRIARGEGIFHMVNDKVFSIIKPRESIKDDGGYLDEHGRLHFAINPNEPKKIIHHLIDRIIDIYPFNRPPKYNHPEKKTRHRNNVLDPIDIWDKVHNEKKSQLRIAKEICQIEESPNDNPIVKSHYEQVRRAYKKAKQIMKPSSF